MILLLHVIFLYSQTLGDDLRGICTNYHAEPGLGLSCNVELSALPSYDIDDSVRRQCVRLSGTSDPLLSYQPLVDTGHTYQVILHVSQVILNLCLLLTYVEQ